MKKNLYIFQLLLVTACAGTFLCLYAGCGKEGKPLPPLTKDNFLPAPFALSGLVDHMGQAFLQWKYPALSDDKRQQAQGFEIFAADPGPDHCRGCPMVFTKVGTTLMPGMRFSMALKKEMDYFIKVRAFGFDTDIVSAYSNTIQLP